MLASLSPAMRVSSSTRNRPYSFSFSPCRSARSRKLDVVGLAAGEVLQRGAARGWRHEPQVGLQALAEAHAALGRPLPEDTLHARERHEVIHHLGAGTGRQHVEVTARLGAAPEAADEIEGGVRADGPQVRDQRVRLLPHL